jgi:hypothetical protein
LPTLERSNLCSFDCSFSSAHEALCLFLSEAERSSAWRSRGCPEFEFDGGSAALAALVDGLLDAWIETADEQSQGGNVFG